jgi:hypothetical protein
VKPVAEVDIDGVPLFVDGEVVDDLAESFQREEAEFCAGGGVLDVGEAAVDDDAELVSVSGLFDEKGADIASINIASDSIVSNFEETRFDGEGAKSGGDEGGDGLCLIGGHVLFLAVAFYFARVFHFWRRGGSMTKFTVSIRKSETECRRRRSMNRGEEISDVDASDEVFVDFIHAFEEISDGCVFGDAGVRGANHGKSWDRERRVRRRRGEDDR